MNSGSLALAEESGRVGAQLSPVELIALRYQIDPSITPDLARELDALIEQLPH